MDLSKLITEIHTGRFFGSYFYWLVDLASFGMIGLAVSGLMVVFYRKKIKKAKTSKKIITDEEMEIDKMIDISESIEGMSIDSQNIHDMVEHISMHLEKCKTIYSTSQEKDEMDTIGKHISTLDKKIHRLMDNLDGFAKLAQDIGANSAFPADIIQQENQNLNNKKGT